MFNATVNIAAEVMGAGVLSLPHMCANLGWVLGLGSACSFALCSAYSGVLLKRTKIDFYPDAESFAELANASVGRRFGIVTCVAMLSQWALLLPYFMIALVSSLRLAVPELPADRFVEWAAAAAALLLLPLQVQTLHSLSYASALSTAAVLVAVALVLGSLGVADHPSPLPPQMPPPHAHISSSAAPPAAASLPSPSSPPTPWPPYTSHATSLWPPALSRPGGVNSADVLAWAGSVCAFVFAFQGQGIFLEIMREMRAPEHFGSAVLLANSGMTAIYLLAITVGYGTRGEGVSGFLPDSMQTGLSRRVVGILLALHTAVRCQPDMHAHARAPRTALCHRSVHLRTACWIHIPMCGWMQTGLLPRHGPATSSRLPRTALHSGCCGAHTQRPACRSDTVASDDDAGTRLLRGPCNRHPVLL